MEDLRSVSGDTDKLERAVSFARPMSGESDADASRAGQICTWRRLERMFEARRVDRDFSDLIARKNRKTACRA